jgi:uncharacterized protein
MLSSVGTLLWGALLIIILAACAPQVEVASSDKPITINLNVKIDREIQMKVEKDLDKVISTAASSASALSLDEAKAKRLVGERTDGYLGAVNTSNAETQALIADVNQKRREAYEDIAKRNRTPLTSVESLAGEKAIRNTKTGHFIEGPGRWIKK